MSIKAIIIVTEMGGAIATIMDVEKNAPTENEMRVASILDKCIRASFSAVTAAINGESASGEGNSVGESILNAIRAAMTQ